MGVDTTTAKVGKVLKKRRSSQALGNRPLTRAAAAATTAAKVGTSSGPILQPIPKVSIPSLSTEVMDSLAATAAATAAADARAAGAAAVTGNPAPPPSYAAAAATPAAAPAPARPSVPVIDL